MFGHSSRSASAACRCWRLQPAFRVDQEGSRYNDTLTRLKPFQDLDPFAKTPSRFDLARLEAAFAVLDIDPRALAGID